MRIIRTDSHAGSWYVDDAERLGSQLSSWLCKPSEDLKPAKAIIVPHAGYKYSGACAAYAFKQLDPEKIKRVFIFGPSHHLDIGSRCALSSATECETPFYNLTVDEEVCDQLKDTGEFVFLTIEKDEAEHSVEMQLPYIAKLMENHRNEFKIVPIVVGSLNAEKEALYGRIFAPYLSDPSTVFVISSDFCHWGERFRYQYYHKKDGAIWQSIENLDRMGMRAIETLDPPEFSAYIQNYNNTICGRRGISVLLHAVATARRKSELKWEMKFVHYAQSSHCQSMADSSVSYAAGVLMVR
ncbi:unnamed protein product [Calicophoron daubneyi]|uniref:Protein MEMO1 n=1 Tax=Calicophoron daubneyi TaxID=300641 RepID=A0AAV2TCW0_CALDB